MSLHDATSLGDSVLFRTAAEWWVRLREIEDDPDTLAQWIAWCEADERHIAAFEQVSEFAAEMVNLDGAGRERLIRRFDVGIARRWRYWAAAAVLVLGLAFGAYAGWKHYFPEAPWQVYASATAVNREIDLADGSHVVLGGASELRVRLSAERRSIELQSGEAFFRVAHDSEREFTVRTGRISIHAVGTAFDVRRSGERVQLIVAEGRVRLSSDDGSWGLGPSSRPALFVDAGQKVVFDPSASQLSFSSATAQQATSWQEDRLEFIDEPLGSVVANVNRYASPPLVISTAELNTLTFTGTVYTNSIDGWLSALPQAIPVEIVRSADKVTLVKSDRAKR